MCKFIATAPADVTETLDIKSETSTDSTTTTIIPDTTTIFFIDSRHNEVDAKLPTTPSDIDEKIESIEADSDGRSSSLSSSTSETGSTTEIVRLDEFTENTTNRMDKLFSTAGHEETANSKISTQEPEEIDAEVKEIQKPTSKVEFERFVTEKKEEVNESTTKGFIESDFPSSTITSTEATPRLFVPSTDGTTTNSYNSSERTQAIDRIRKTMQAHVLRAILTLLSEARKQELEQTEENSQPEDQNVMESQITDESFSVISGGDYDSAENNDDEVTTDDAGKVITFDKKLQRYVYMDKEDYEVHYPVDYVSF